MLNELRAYNPGKREALLANAGTMRLTRAFFLRLRLLDRNAADPWITTYLLSTAHSGLARTSFPSIHFSAYQMNIFISPCHQDGSKTLSRVPCVVLIVLLAGGRMRRQGWLSCKSIFPGSKGKYKCLYFIPLITFGLWILCYSRAGRTTFSDWSEVEDEWNSEQGVIFGCKSLFHEWSLPGIHVFLPSWSRSPVYTPNVRYSAGWCVFMRTIYIICTVSQPVWQIVS